jgi:hypothetical protein
MARDEWEEDFIEAAKLAGSRRIAARAVGIHPETPRYHARPGRDQSFKARMEAALAEGRQRRRSLGPWLLLLALALPAPLAAIESPPFALGSTGLTLTVRLRQWTEATGLWADVSPHTVTVTEEGSGEYSLANLPAATGTNRYAATVALSSDATRGLASYVYGATPGVRLVWQEEIALPSSPLVFRRGDSFGSLSLVVTRGLPAAACDPETTATMDAANLQTNADLFENRAATITNCELDATTGTYGATITSDLIAADLDTVGRFAATATLCYEVASCQTLPGANLLRFEVVRALGD